MVSRDDKTAAKLLWQLKEIATKEVEGIPPNRIHSFFLNTSSSSSSSSSSNEDSSESDMRGRTVSVGSVDMVTSNTAVTPVLSFSNSKSLLDSNRFLLGDNDSTKKTVLVNRTKNIDHHDWSKCGEQPVAKKTPSHPLLCSPDSIIKQCKKKRESLVGTNTKSGKVRATLKKKVSRCFHERSLRGDFQESYICWFHRLCLLSPLRNTVFVEAIP